MRRLVEWVGGGVTTLELAGLLEVSMPEFNEEQTVREEPVAKVVVIEQPDGDVEVLVDSASGQPSAPVIDERLSVSGVTDGIAPDVGGVETVVSDSENPIGGVFQWHLRTRKLRRN